MTICDFIWTGYPHEGCAEFGPPDEMACDSKAIWKFTFPNFVPLWDEDNVEHAYLCTFHATTCLLFDDILRIEKLESPATYNAAGLINFIRFLAEEPPFIIPIHRAITDGRVIRLIVDSADDDDDFDVIEREDPWPL